MLHSASSSSLLGAAFGRATLDAFCRKLDTSPAGIWKIKFTPLLSGYQKNSPHYSQDIRRSYAFRVSHSTSNKRFFFKKKERTQYHSLSLTAEAVLQRRGASYREEVVWGTECWGCFPWVKGVKHVLLAGSAVELGGVYYLTKNYEQQFYQNKRGKLFFEL